jgi:CMP-N-acetylneuraminic acid synthetase
MEPNGSISAIVRRLEQKRGLRRQDQTPEITMNAALYLFSTKEFRRTGQIYSDSQRSYGHVMPAEYSVEVDRAIDLAWAEFLVDKGYVERGLWE